MRRLLSSIAFPWFITALLPGPALAALSFEERVAAQRAVEEVYWRHRIWPEANPGTKPQLSAVMPEASIRSKVEADLRASKALDDAGLAVTAGELQEELNRMARHTRAPGVLRDLFAAVGDDAYVAAEVLARPVVVERKGRAQSKERYPVSESASIEAAPGSYSLPEVVPTSCTPNEISTFGLIGPIGPRSRSTAVWTGTEMIVWGGSGRSSGGRYNPATDTWSATSQGPGCPVGRSSHTAVWTGTRMIVWGGSSPSASLSGGMYDPSTDAWVPTSTGAGTPDSGSDHVAVWTGSRMVVWGGRASSPNYVVNTGARFDPVTNTWAATSSIGAPSPRSSAAAVWTGSWMVVWGGAGVHAFDRFSDGGRYDPVADQWLPVTDAGIAARSASSAVWTGTRVLFWGGETYFSKYQDGGSYDPVNNTWIALGVDGNTPAARNQSAAVWAGSKMVVWGGQGSGGTALGSGGIYDPAIGTWHAMATAGMAPHASPVAVWTGSQMLIWGEGLGRYDPAAEVWIDSPGPVPAARSSAATVWTGTEMIVWGGNSSNTFSSSSYLSTGGVYTPATDSWRPTSSVGVPVARSGHTAIWTGTKMIVWGGVRLPESPAYQLRALASGGRYDPASDTWQSTANSSEAVFHHSSVWTGSRMNVWGGEDETGTRHLGHRSYDPVANAWTALSDSSAPVPRSSHAAAWTGKEMLVWGGSNTSGTGESSGGAFNPQTGHWRPISMNGVPAGRPFPNASWTGRELIVWGGGLNTGGRYNPVTDTWTPTPVNGNTPSARTRSSVVWTGNEMVVWGGEQGSTRFDNGASYDPVTNVWTQLPSFGLQSRSRHVAVWTGSEMILWGGEVSDGMAADGVRHCRVDCTAPTTWYQDADGDGYGNPSVTYESCPQPAAFVADATDCNDWNPRAYHVSPEICGDGLDNDCDGIEVDPAPEICGDDIDNDCNGITDEPDIPVETPTLQLNRVAETAILTWSAVQSALFYDVVVGRIGLLRSSGGDFTIATFGCSRDDIRDTSDSDTFTSNSGDGFWYLVRAVSCGGAGTYDGASPPQVGSRDAGLAPAPPACP